MIIKKIIFLVLASILTNLTTFATAHATSLIVDSEQDENNSSLLTESTTSDKLEDKLLEYAKNTINELNEASQVTQVVVDDREVYIYHSFSANLNQTNTSVPAYAVYTNRRTPTVILQRKKVPDSSSLLSLIAFAGLFIKINQQTSKGLNPSFKVSRIAR
ncbi:MAG TPA: hypothetical protein DCL61_05370 [Cyanobacteria bacterium UBA12227]|nr:hypothetical protein [Cyanobacteria bacterium UBA12227]